MAYLAGLIPFELLLTWLVERGILSEFTGSIIGLIYLPVWLILHVIGLDGHSSGVIESLVRMIF